ncbi:hypothetical protein SLS60_006416 [Paraconiothyrium brasiliense]|uniref:Uncharacterized protein n=1 Tax=Paraconiothyrium brasiliense TaxID=300254 RepID=A0ABR3RAP2_9PLEO
MSSNIAKSVTGPSGLKPPAPNTTANILRDIEEGRITLYTPMVLQPNKSISVRSRDPYQIRIGNSSPITIASTGLARYTAPPDAKLDIEPLTYPGFGRHWESLPVELKMYVLEYNLSFDEIQLPSATKMNGIPQLGEIRLREDSQWPEILSHHLALPGSMGVLSGEVFGRNTFAAIPRGPGLFRWVPQHSIAQHVRSLRLTLYVDLTHWTILSRIRTALSGLNRLHVTFDWSISSPNGEYHLKQLLMNPPTTRGDVIYFPKTFKLKVDFTGTNSQRSRNLEELMMTKFLFIERSGKNWVEGKRIFN